MHIEEMGINGAWLAKSTIHRDSRGSFREWFKADEISQITGRNFEVQQANISISNKGVIRGIHYSLAVVGQAKWVTCVSGSIWDVVVDIRPNSPTFKEWVGVQLDAKHGNAIFLSENLGHAFIALEENTVVSYLLKSKYSSEQEFEINPLDPELAIPWPYTFPILSQKDAEAPTLLSQLNLNKLPKI